MSKASDWESLMNGVFGSGGRLNSGSFSSASAPEKAPQPSSAPARRLDADSLSALKQNSQALDQALKKQAEQIAAMGDALTSDMKRDGLLRETPSPAPAAAAPEQGYTAAIRESFSGLAETLGQKVLGQPAYLKKLTMAFRRPFVMGTEGEKPKNSILIYGPEGTGRHYALTCLAAEMAHRGLLSGPQIAWLDLGDYPGPAAEKIFLQDLYGALNAPGDILAFDNYQTCHPGFLRLLADLVQEGEVSLDTRYVLQKGMLVDAGNALVPGAVSALSARGKYLVFFSGKGPEKLADVFGASFVNALGDVCATSAFAPESLSALAAQQLNALAHKVRTRLGFTLLAGPDLRDAAAACYSPREGAEPVLEYVDRLFRALSQYTLENDPEPGGCVRLTVRNDRVWACFEAPGTSSGALPEIDLLSLLPGEYAGALEEVRKELENIVGLEEIKEYVLGLKDNVAVQRRRLAQGMKTSSVNMHMIFAGNPGTGKTTIARLISRYLKAIGALRGGQLVEVTRADLVGRYVGHTAPLTEQVIQSALGGVLFIDEAYSLFRGREDSFGLEAIDTLVKGIEDHRDELVVILAGYTREMKDFLESNSGLASRFPNFIQFPDYSARELLDITHIQAKSKGYRMDAACDAPLLAFYTRCQAEDPAKNGNGRLARNTLEAAILNQSRRLMADPEAPLDLLLWTDFELGEEPASPAPALTQAPPPAGV